MENSPLDRLSPEIRNAVYAHTLKQDYICTIFPYERGFSYGKGVEPDLTRVCKQIRQESQLLYYSINTFMVYVNSPCNRNHNKLSEWLESIGEGRASSIQQLKIFMGGVDRRDWEDGDSLLQAGRKVVKILTDYGAGSAQRE